MNMVNKLTPQQRKEKALERFKTSVLADAMILFNELKSLEPQIVGDLIKWKEKEQ